MNITGRKVETEMQTPDTYVVPIPPAFSAHMCSSDFPSMVTSTVVSLPCWPLVMGDHLHFDEAVT